MNDWRGPARSLLTLLSLIALLFLFLPVAVLFVRGIGTRGWQGLPTSGVVEAILISLLTTSASALLTVIFGTPLAYVFARMNFPMKRLLNVLVELPIVLPPAVAGLALLITFGRRGLLGPLLDSLGLSLAFTTAAVVLAQTFVSAPFYIRAAQIGFQSVSPEIESAARVDGASGWALFRFITLPLTLRTLLAGLTLSWARALGEFGATILFAGSLQGRTQTMPLFIYNVLERDIDAAIWTGLLLVILALAALLLAQWLRPRENEADQ
jgi:molybdate transport system permease protein